MRHFAPREIDEVAERLGLTVPRHVRDFLQTAAVIGDTVVIGESRDESEMGAEFQWMDPSQMTSEGTECFPGATVSKHVATTVTHGAGASR